MSIKSTVWQKGIFTVVGLLYCVMLSWQYPLQTTFPIGGDAVRYISRAQAIAGSESIASALDELTHNSSYPIVTAGLAIVDFIGPNWPELFVWLMALAYIATGMALGWLVYRAHTWQSGVIALAGWGLTTMLSGHYEDATLAQLLSLPLLLVALTYWTRQRPLAAVLISIVASTIHPMTTLLLILVLGLTAVAMGFRFKELSDQGRKVWYVMTGFVLIAVSAGLTGNIGNVATANFSPEERVVNVAEYLKSPIGLLLVLAPLGLLALWQQQKNNRVGTLLLLTFFITSLLAAFNDRLGVSLFTFRFEPYLLLTVTSMGAIGLSHMLKTTFRSGHLQATFIVLLFSVAGVGLWQEAAVVYNYYESPSRYGRIHNTEIAAIEWLDENLPAGHVVSTAVNRHSEWIPVLSRHTWEPLGEGHKLFHTTENEQRQVTDELGADAVLFFGRREPVADNFKENGKLLYHEGKVSIYDLR